MLVRKILDCKEWRCCTDQKTEYRTAQAATRVVEVFMVELVKGEYSLYVGVEVVDEEQMLGTVGSLRGLNERLMAGVRCR